MTSPFDVAAQDYEPGGASFRPGRALVVAPALDLRETGTIEVAASETFFGADGASFANLIDIINPLQHLPVIGLLYRTVTGDTIAPAAQLAGGGLYGGVTGLFSAVGSVFLDEAAGDEMSSGFAALLDSGSTAESGQPVRLSDASLVATSSAVSEGGNFSLGVVAN
jgi:hypothetical protein